MTGSQKTEDRNRPSTREEKSMPEIEPTPMNPLAHVYYAVVRAGEITQDSPAHQLKDGAAYILHHGVERNPTCCEWSPLLLKPWLNSKKMRDKRITNIHERRNGLA
jgi:hypothetical protein